MIFVEIRGFKRNIGSDCVRNALLISDWVEMEAAACRFERLGCAELERFPRAGDGTI